ncbi:MAG: IMPACT family protein [Nocardioidaceae bacterium]
MSATTSYLTIATDTDTETVTEDRRSRFSCRLRRADTEAAARRVLEQARSDHVSAGHHCSAFVLGPEASVQRCSDDGEPGGTAGAPMLEVLRGSQVSDVVAVVTRYFGGTLLGAGGLVRAYAHAVRNGLDHADLVTRRLVRLLDITVDHAEAGRLEHDLRTRRVEVQEVTYGAYARLRVASPLEQLADVRATVAALTGGSAEVAVAGDAWTLDA